jgi:hypothetical protein
MNFECWITQDMATVTALSGNNRPGEWPAVHRASTLGAAMIADAATFEPPRPCRLPVQTRLSPSHGSAGTHPRTAVRIRSPGGCAPRFRSDCRVVGRMVAMAGLDLIADDSL